jgi:membrane protein
MKYNFKNLWQILKQTFKSFVDLNIPSLSAALSYYTVFSIAPMLIVVISLCDIFYGREAIEGKIYSQIRSFVGNDAALEIQQLISNAHISKDITWASAIGIIALVFAATGVFTQIQSSINLIWRLKAKPRKGWLKILFNRLLSFSMLVTIGFLSLVSLVINALMVALVDKLIRIFPQMAVYVAYSLNLLLTFITTTILFGIIFKVLPDAKIKWKDVRVGSITTAILFMLGRFAIGFYLGKSNISNSYGAAGSLVIILLWVYYSSIILYFGAAFTKAHAQQRGSRIYPNEYAVWIEQLEVEHKDALQNQDTATVKTIDEAADKYRAG